MSQANHGECLQRRWRWGLLRDVCARDRETVTKRYARGWCLVLRHEARASVEEFIVGERFRKCPEDQRVYTHNKRYRVYEVRLPGEDRNFMMKVAWVNPEYRLGRRINVWISQRLRNSALRAVAGAMALAEHGVRTIRPVACWTWRPSFFRMEQYFLYEKMEADFSCRDLMLRRRAQAQAGDAQLWDAVIESLGALLKQVFDSGLRHHDPALGNILVRRGAGRVELGLIDTDHVRRTRATMRFLKRVGDMYSLRRLRLDDADMRRVLQRSMPKDYDEFWFKVYAAFRDDRHRLFRRRRKRREDGRA